MEEMSKNKGIGQAAMKGRHGQEERHGDTSLRAAAVDDEETEWWEDTPRDPVAEDWPAIAKMLEENARAGGPDGVGCCWEVSSLGDTTGVTCGRLQRRICPGERRRDQSVRYGLRRRIARRKRHRRLTSTGAGDNDPWATVVPSFVRDGAAVLELGSGRRRACPESLAASARDTGGAVRDWAKCRCTTRRQLERRPRTRSHEMLKSGLQRKNTWRSCGTLSGSHNNAVGSEGQNGDVEASHRALSV